MRICSVAQPRCFASGQGVWHTSFISMAISVGACRRSQTCSSALRSLCVAPIRPMTLTVIDNGSIVKEAAIQYSIKSGQCGSLRCQVLNLNTQNTCWPDGINNDQLMIINPNSGLTFCSPEVIQRHGGSSSSEACIGIRYARLGCPRSSVSHV